MSKSLSGTRVQLRLLHEQDWQFVQRWIRDREIARLMTYDMQKFALRDGFYYGIELMGKRGQSGRLIGYLGLHDWNPEEKTSELTICIADKRLWSKGLGTEAIRILLKDLFRHSSMQGVYLRVFRDNPRAIHCYEKCGFRKIGLLKAGWRVKFGWRDIILMEYTRSDWAAERVQSKNSAS